jgi:hypothetical protein
MNIHFINKQNEQTNLKQYAFYLSLNIFTHGRNVNKIFFTFFMIIYALFKIIYAFFTEKTAKLLIDRKSNTFYNKAFLRSVNIIFYDQLAHLDELDLLFGVNHSPFW